MCALDTTESVEMCALDTTDSVEITNKMQPCNRIYYSKIN